MGAYGKSILMTYIKLVKFETDENSLKFLIW